MKTRWILALIVVVLSLAALACSVGGGKAPEAVATVQSAAPAKSADKTPAPAQSSDTSGDAALSLQSRQAGLDKLKSYRMKWQAQWNSTESGKTESASWEWVEEFSSNPAALHWNWHALDAQSKSTNTEMEAWQIGETTYMQTKDDQGKAQCFSFSSSDQKDQLTKGMFSPDTLGSVSNAKYVGTETVNSIKAKHYKYDEKSAALFGSAKVSGDIYVAVDGAYVVKDTLAWSGAGGLFGQTGAKGDGKWTWELSDVNQNLAIKAPEGCGGAAGGLPMMKDASDKNTLGDMVSYKTASKIADAVAFYKAEMPKAGWKLQGDPQVTEELAMLEFGKDNQKAQVMITIDQDKTQVLITISK